ncbi:MAG: hypothetical protein BAA04_07465 [Firmicutes bacterium ZCTH02-B6]|nr:MAG: hypothetical protein BAA04_07465 [Firmicutes bacterium ZCTH02-B6]
MGMYITGIASGLDTDAWIEAVMALERRPITQLQQRKTTLQQQRDAWRDINTRLNNLSSRLSDLRLSSTFLNRTATSSDANVVSVSAGTAATPGSYRIEVEQLAQAHRIASGRQLAADEAIGTSGTFTIQVGDKSGTVTVEKGDTLADIVQKINDADAGVTAKIIDGRLVLQADVTNKKIEFSGDVDVLKDLAILGENDEILYELLQEAQCAHIKVDRLDIYRDTNTISDVIEGVTFTLKAEGSAAIEIQHDVNRVIERVKAFVDQYNSVQNFIKEKTTDGAVLQGDVLLGRIQSQLRQLATARVDAGGPYNQLAMIGISVDRYGTMTLDEAKLRAALAENPEAVYRLFAADAEDGDGFNGVAVRMGKELEQWLRSNEGLLASRQAMFDARMKDIDRSIERLEARLELREETLRRQFVRLEEVLAAFQTQSAWLSAQLQQLSAFAAYQARGR